MPMRLNGNIPEQPALVYGAETWATKKSQENRLEANEMRMLMWIIMLSHDRNRVSKRGTSDEEDHRQRAQVVRTCQEKRRGARTLE